MNVRQPDLPGLNPTASRSWLPHRVSLSDTLMFVAFLAAYYFAFRYGMSFSQTMASPFWFPDSVMLCALLITRPRRWWIVGAGALAIRLFSPFPSSFDISTWQLLATFVIDLGKGLVTAVLLRRCLVNPIRLETMRDFLVFCLVAVVLVPAAFAFPGAAALAIHTEDYWVVWEQWFLGDAVTHLVVTPAMFYWLFGVRGNPRVPKTTRWWEGGLLAAGLLASGYMAFSVEPTATRFVEARFYAPIPFLFWAAIRFGMVGTGGAILLFAGLATYAALLGHGPFAGQSPQETASALQHFLLLRAVPLYFVAILTEETRAGVRAVRESEARFRSVADTAPVLIWMAGVDKQCDFVNRGWLQFRGRRLEEEIGNGWTEGIHPDDFDRCFDAYVTAFDARRPFEMDCRVRRHDGEYRWILARGVPRHDPSGMFSGYVGTALDITDRKDVEEAQAHLAHAQRLAGMGQLTAMVAHEISQPLLVIMNCAIEAEELMRKSPPPVPQVRTAIADISASTARATDAIRRVRALSRRQDVAMGPVDLNELVADLLRLLSSDIVRRRVSVRQDLGEQLPTAHGDRAGLQQVLLNLIFNAMDAMSVVPEARRVLTVTTRSDVPDRVAVFVKDSGAGVPPEILPKLFLAFTTTKPHGLGLGLSIARSIIEAHHGHLWAENDPNGGAKFAFTIRTSA